MKSAYYTAVTANTYRMAIDRYLAEPAAYRFDPIWKTELESVSHRDYCTGYYFDDPMKNAQTVENAGYVREKAYIGVVEAFDPITRRASVIQRNKISAGEIAELISPGFPESPLLFRISEMKPESRFPQRLIRLCIFPSRSPLRRKQEIL